MLIPLPNVSATNSLAGSADTCPYLYENSNTCLAASASRAVDPAKSCAICCTEDFDECPLFLSRFLRRNPPLYGFSPCTMRDK